MALVHAYISLSTLNINGLNSKVKDRVVEWIKKKPISGNYPPIK